MTSATTISAGPLPDRPGISIERVAPSERLAASRRLIGQAQSGGGGAQRFLDAAARHRIDLTHFWGSKGPDGTLRQVALGVVGAGRAAMVFTSSPARRGDEAELSRVLDRLCGALPGVALAQALLEARESAAREAFLGAGFRSVGTLAYMRRPLESEPISEIGPPDLGGGALVRQYRPGDDPALVAALESSYEQTLDCPELCGLRDTRDVLDSHRATGVHDPKAWWVVERAGQMQGAMLFNPSPEQDAIELVYLGLSPALRGRGAGRALLAYGLGRLAGRPQAFVTCAVDERNTPARRLYASLGFTDMARRLALVKPLVPRAAGA